MKNLPEWELLSDMVLVIIVIYDGLSPVGHQAITWGNTELSIESVVMN